MVPPTSHETTLSISGRGSVQEGLPAVTDVEGFVVSDAFHEAMPEDLEPTVGQSAQGRVVVFPAAVLAS